MVIAYLRISTGRQHLENQEGEIKRYAQVNNLVIDSWVTEIISGKTKREKRLLGRAVRKLKKGDTIIVTELSRLSRTLLEIMEIMKICLDNDVIVHSTKDGFVFGDNLNSKVLSFAFGLAAEIEHKLISQRTREAMAHGKAQGRHMGRKVGIQPKQAYLYTRIEEIRAKLAGGMGILVLCKKYGVAYETFKRFKQKYLDKADRSNENTSLNC